MDDLENELDEADKEEDGEEVDAELHELMVDYDLEKAEAKKIKKIMDEKGVDAEEAMEIREEL